MQNTSIRICISFVLVCAFAGIAFQNLRAQDQQRVIFHVRHVEETALYIDIGRNFGLEEGMRLALFHADALATSAGGKQSAELKVMIVADSSAVCEILNSSSKVRIGDVGFVAAPRISQPPQSEELSQGENRPIVTAFTRGN